MFLKVINNMTHQAMICFNKRKSFGPQTTFFQFDGAFKVISFKKSELKRKKPFLEKIAKIKEA